MTGIRLGAGQSPFLVLQQPCKEGLSVPEAQRGPLVSLWSHGWPVAESWSNLGQPELGAGAGRACHLKVPQGTQLGPEKGLATPSSQERAVLPDGQEGLGQGLDRE